MPSTEVQLLGGSFQDAEGNLLANGKLTLNLDQDEQVNGSTQICGGITIEAPLDENGNIVGSPPVYAWPNDVMDPINCYYTVCAYAENGQLAWGPNVQQILEGDDGTFDVGTWIPNQLAYWIPPPQPVLFETNGIPNDSQTLVNFVDGTNMHITNNGGNVVFNAGTPPLNPYDVVFALPGVTPGEVTYDIWDSPREVIFLTDLNGSVGHVRVPPTVVSTIPVNHNDVQFATVTIGTLGDFTFDSPSQQIFSKDDWLSLELPESDSVMSDIVITFAGIRS